MNSITPLLIASLVVAIAGAAQPTFFRWPDGAATGPTFRRSAMEFLSNFFLYCLQLFSARRPLRHL